MHLLPESFAMFTYAGMWEPVDWASWPSYRMVLYKIYSFLSILLVYTLTVSELAGALLLTDNLQDFTDISFLLVSTISVCCKTASIMLRRRRVIGLADMLMESYCVPRNAVEVTILGQFDKIARFTALSCFVLAETTVLVMSTGPLFQAPENRTLPFKSWLPFEIQATANFWLAYVHQTVAIITCATINVANDTMICGFMVLACSQLELLNKRLLLLPRIARSIEAKKNRADVRNVELKIISGHIQHHNHILKFAETINVIFTPVILLQFCMSSVVLSLSVYQLAMSTTNGIQFITMVLYLACMLVEFFMYCWFGNEVTLKSLDFGQAIYDIDWTGLRLQTNKNLMIMMMRARRPIVMSCGSMITLSIKSFTTIVKASYSAFNVLQRSSHQ